MAPAPAGATCQEERVMGNRDSRGREKKKPKKKEIKQSSAPARPATEYKYPAPSQPRQPDGETSKSNTDPGSE